MSSLGKSVYYDKNVLPLDRDIPDIKSAEMWDHGQLAMGTG